jgi:glycosyltransferase involved in cell wall biosynthesis
MPGTPQFTVFTATYNRAHTIDRVYNSLRAQTLRDFEWLVIDDGSTDNTAQAIATWAKTAAFPIRYIRQDHAGKHFAHNRAAREARGELFVTLDSDDACAPETLERIAHHWRSIPPGERAAYSGVGTLCRNQFGKIVGDRYPSDVFDAGLPEILFVRRVKGEKWYIVRTDLVRRRHGMAGHR